MKKIILAIIVMSGFIYLISTAKSISQQRAIALKKEQVRQWDIKSVDTMKYSRDTAMQFINDVKFDKTIEAQIKSIVSTGATYVAIDTPYDDQFLPYLVRWINVARRNNLNIWFRGNFSSWQGWFGYPKNLTYPEHIELTKNFIINHSNLFISGDIFSPCPECENGGPGDPRDTEKVDEYRKFLISERNLAVEEFSKLDKKVMIMDSMNYDVANLVMDKETAKAVGGIVVIDHYVDSSNQLKNDIENLSKNSNAKIILGEFGAPIPDIHGNMNEQQQAEWLDDTLDVLSRMPEVIGVNYWVSHGGSTALFNDRNIQRPGARVLEKYFKLEALPDKVL